MKRKSPRIHIWNDPDNNRLKSSEELSEDGKKVSEELSELSEEMSEHCLKVSGNGSISCLIGVQTAVTSGYLTPYRAISTLLPIAVVVASGVATMTNKPLQVQVFMYSLAVGLLILCDTFRVFSRLLAIQNRLLLASDFFMVCMGCVKPSQKYFVLVTIWTLATVGIIKLTNRACVFGHNWFVSDSVRKAVARNPESKGWQAWSNYGKRQVRVVLSECGLKFNDRILDSYGSAIFLAGFYSAVKNGTKLKNKVNQAQEIIDDMSYQAENMEANNTELAEQVEALEEELARLKQFEHKCHELETKLAELSPAVPEEPTEVAEAEADSLENTIKEMLLDGGSINGIAKACNVTRYQVEKVRKQMKGELTA